MMKDVPMHSAGEGGGGGSRGTGGRGQPGRRRTYAGVAAGMRDLRNPDRTYFFSDGVFRSYDWDIDAFVDAGTSPTFILHLPESFRNDIDAVLDGHGRYAGYTYFFKGADCCVYDRTGQWGKSPQAYGGRWNLPEEFASNLDGAINGKRAFEGKAYFFKGSRYARYDWGTNQTDFVASISAFDLKGGFVDGFDAVVNGAGQYEGKTYFIKGDEYVRYNWETGRIDEGYPRSMDARWRSLSGLYDAPERRFVLYVTLDARDHRNLRSGDAGRHAGNIAGLVEKSRGWGRDLEIRDLWCMELSDTVLADPHVLCMFLSGSFDEWFRVFHDQGWQAQLDDYCGKIRNTDVPILAVCGSHQLLGYAYADWGAVSHMAASGETPATVAMEGIERRFLAPNPRIGEVGVFSFVRAVDDPLLKGLPDVMWFRESHHDQILFPPDGATSLLIPLWDEGVAQAPTRSAGTIARAPGEEPEAFMHRGIASQDELCAIQLLRYGFPGQSRILYSAQFHPELISADARAEENSAMLIRNFLDLAADYWAAA